MSSENAAVLAQQAEAAATPAAPGPDLIVCRLCGEDFVTTPESCLAVGGTVLSRTGTSITVTPDVLIVCQLSGQDFVTTPESCLAVGGTIVGQSSPTFTHPVHDEIMDQES